MSEAATASSDQKAMAPLRGIKLVLLTLAMGLATFMEVLDISIVNVSVHTIAGDMGVSTSEGTWAISAYALSSAIAQPLTGWLARRFGEVRLFCTSISLFIVFSALCGLAHSMIMLVVFRLLQGAVSGPLVPLTQTLLLKNYPAEKRSMAIGLWAMTVVVAPICGPILGGWLTDNYSWPWIFYINIPVGILSLVLSLWLLRGRESKTTRVPVDVVGLGLLIVGVGALQFMLDNGNDHDWFASPMILTLGIVALVGITFLVAWVLMHARPVVNLRLFGQRNFAIGTLCLSLGMFAFFGNTVITPNWVQQVMGYNATWAGLAVAPIGILALFMSPLVGRFQSHFDLRILVTFGFAVFAFCSFWAAGFNNQIAFGELAMPRFVMGAGVAFFFVPINQIIFAGLRDDQIADASGLSNFCRTLATSISTAVSVTLYDHRSIYHHARLSESVVPGSPATEHYLDQLGTLGLHDQRAWAMMNEAVNAQAATMAFNDVLWLFGIIFVITIVMIWLARPPFPSGGPMH